MELDIKTIRNLTEPKYHRPSSKNLEVIDICHLFNVRFASGSVIKYVIDAGKEDNNDKLLDLNKALIYLQTEIEHLEKKQL